MKIKIQTRMVYGRPLHYPMCDTSTILSCIGKRKNGPHTLSEDDLKLIRELKYDIEQIPQFKDEK